MTFTAAGVVSAATLAPGIAPGGLMTIFGSGLAGPGSDSTVEVNGVPATVVTKSPFQINAQVPPDLAPGSYSVRVQSPYGSAGQTVDVSATAPAIYSVSGNLTQARGVVSNEDGTMNSPLTPGKRGQSLTIYCTGLGAVSDGGAIFATQSPVTVILTGLFYSPASPV